MTSPSTRLEPSDIEARIAAVPAWYHRIDLGHGITSPGIHDSPTVLKDLERMGLPLDFRGRRVLDLGCRDGFFSFEMERRGAEVVAVDYAEPDRTGFSVAASILGSRVEYHTANVYDVTREEYGEFHFVLMLGLLYHLRNPMLAMDRVRALVRQGGVLFLETQLAVDEQVATATAPAWEYAPKDSLNADATNCWLPNRAALRALLEECEYEVLSDFSHGWVGGRGWITGRAISDEDASYFRELDHSVGRWGEKRAK